MQIKNVRQCLFVSSGHDVAVVELRLDTGSDGTLGCIVLMSQKSIIVLSSLLSDPAARDPTLLYSIATN